MSVSFTTAAENMEKFKQGYHDVMGYGHASYEIMNSFSRAGISVDIANPSSSIGISMGFPIDYKFYPGQYRIGYTAWESTELKDGWLEKMLDVDELWATSSWTAEVFKERTGREDIHVYPHGITTDWEPKKRSSGPIFRFLHVGEPQARKNGQLVVDTFIELFGNDESVQLVLKASNINSTRIFNPDGSLAGSPDSRYKNIKIITEYLSHNQMIELYHKSHAMVYPTTGEGFGFIPLQSLATGMPTISTYQWAEYKNYITNPIKSYLVDSEYPRLHPGKVYSVDKEDLKRNMLDVYVNYDKYSQDCYKNSFKIHMDYDWDHVSYDTINRVKKILKTRGL